MKQCYQNAIIALFLFCTIGAVSAQTALPAEDIAEKTLAATVYLEMMDANGKTLGIGSGFFVKPNIIATNYHVIEGAAKGTAKLVGKNTTYNIEGVTATDKTNDLALLQVPAYGIYGIKGIKPLALGDSDKVRIGETVYVAGNPKGLEGTFSDGIISSRRDKLTRERLQMTAPISPGSSGGPVLNKKGEVIGVSFAGHRALDAQNLNFAIPSKYLKTLLIRSGTTRPLGKTNVSITSETYFKWGNAKFDLGNYEGAIADYNKSLQLDPNSDGTYYNRGIVKVKLGQYAAAVTDFDATIRFKPDYVEAYNNRGVAKGELGQYAAAIADYDMAIRLKPDYAEAYNNRGGEKTKIGQYTAAIADCGKAIQLKPNLPEAYNNRGVAKAKLGQHAAAIADYDMAIRLKPDYTEAYINRGGVKSDLGQYTVAIDDYNTAIQLKPDLSEAYYNRGTVKVKLKQYSAAITDFDEAIRQKSDHAAAYQNRGVAKYMLGRIQEAKQDLQSALKLAEKAGDVSVKAHIESILQQIH